MKKKLVMAVAIAILIVLVSIGSFLIARQLAYARVERLTELHAHEFDSVVAQINASFEETDNQVDYYKVFDYTPSEAKLYVTRQFENGNRHGLYVYLARDSEEWQVIKTELIWARYGSADGWVWPPYW